MSKTRVGGLGRGLGALIPTAPAVPAGAPESVSTNGAHAAVPAPPPATTPDGPLPVPGASFTEVEVAAITANPRQPRQVFDEDALAELTHSIREFGVLQPVVVRRRDEGYELVMGERRLRAASQAGLATIPAIVRDTDDDAMLRNALL